jgi:RNA 2',3'-cyclic 3'-phosphodiesterase
LTDEPRVRAFVALELDARLREAIGALQDRFRALAGLRLVRPEGVHLTLRFLGASSRSQLEQIAPQLASAAADCRGFDARVQGLGAFPAHGAPRVLWLGIELPEAVRELQRACERAARAAGFEPEERPFAPHLTLGRFRERVPRPTLAAADLGTTRIDTLALVRSEMRPGGAVYTPLVRLPLGGAP